jgi:hypothetical protein
VALWEIEPSFVGALPALGGVLGAEGSIAGQQTAVGGDEVVDEVLELLDAW